MLLAAADPSSYNLFSRVIGLFCFIIDYALGSLLSSVHLFHHIHIHTENYHSQ